MRRRKFSREFKIEAVKLVRERGVPTYRGQGCKQRAYLNRRLCGPMVLLARTSRPSKSATSSATMVWDILLKGNVVRGSPPPPERPTRKRPALRIVREAINKQGIC